MDEKTEKAMKSIARGFLRGTFFVPKQMGKAAFHTYTPFGVGRRGWWR